MTTTTDATLAEQVHYLLDRTEIADLIDRFSRDLDERTAASEPFDVEWVRRYFTEDATVAYPVGEAAGADAVAELIDGTGMAPFQRTQHVTTNYVIDLDRDRASVRFNLIATHVLADAVREERGLPPGARFTVGDHYGTEVVRTPAGWRFARQVLHVTWTDGDPPR